MKRIYKIKVFVDTNVLIDYLVPDRENHTQAVDLFSLILTSTIEAAISTQSILDAAYIGNKYEGFNSDGFRRAMESLLTRTNVSSIDSFDIHAALRDPNEDIEDNAQIAFADSQRCDVIVTYDKKIHSRRVPAPLIVMNTEEFLNQCMVSK